LYTVIPIIRRSLTHSPNIINVMLHRDTHHTDDVRAVSQRPPDEGYHGVTLHR
jgi:hypothetical protein